MKSHTGATKLLAALPRRPGSMKRLGSVVVALSQLGWSRSADRLAPVDTAGGPLPWYTYPAIEWLNHRLASTDQVFEFGAGNSSLWLAARTARVVSVEHDPEWARKVRSHACANLTVVHRPDPGDPVEASDDDPYIQALAESAMTPDLVVVDARARAACLRAAARAVASNGLIILDNSDRIAYRPALAAMHQQGWGRIDFLGPAPGSGRLSNTSAFLRPSASRWLLANVPLDQVGYSV